MMADHRARQPDSGQGPTGPSEPTVKLGALLAEMEALMRVMPAAQADDIRTRADYVAQVEEDAVEAGFDNMPV